MFQPVILMALVCFSLCGQDRGARSVTVMGDFRFEGSYALLVGVSDYTGDWPDLPAIADEMRRVQAALERQGFVVETVADPNHEELEDAFKDFINTYGYTPNNRLLLYFAGHGYTRKQGTKGYLVPADAPDPRKNERGFLRRSLPMSQILTWAGLMEARHALFLFDSCFSGTVFQTRGLPDTPPPLIQEIASKPVRQFITAGGADEVVPAKSTFTPIFIRSIEGEGDLNRDGFVTGTELGMHLKERLLNHYQTGQTPQYGKIRDPDLDRGDFVFSVQRQPPPPAPEDESTEREVKDSPSGQERTLAPEETVRLADEVAQALASPKTLNCDDTGLTAGVRFLFCQVSSVLSLETLEWISGRQIFVKGPHHPNELDYRAHSFGHYNRDFVRWAIDLIPERPDEGAFAGILEKIYNRHLFQYAHAFYRAYHFIHRDPFELERIKTTYLDRIDLFTNPNRQTELGALHTQRTLESPLEPGAVLGRVTSRFRADSNIGYALGEVAPGFWIRREIDGTADLFYQGLTRLFSAYDSEMLLPSAFSTTPSLSASETAGDVPVPLSPKGARSSDHVALLAAEVEKQLGETRKYGCSFNSRGLRYLECQARSILGLENLELISGLPVFVEGPHSSGRLDYDANSFGHYNRDFVRWAVDLIPEPSNPGAAGRALGRLYDRYLVEHARGFYLAYQFLQRNPEELELVKASYLDLIELWTAPSRRAELNSRRSSWNTLPISALARINSKFRAENEVSSWQGQVAPGFWIRREIDGTADLFYEGLTRVLRAYDPEFLTSPRGRASRSAISQ